MRIITHNAYWFQGDPSRWGNEQVRAAPDVLDALTQLYAATAVDVLCLQEVHQVELVEDLARALGMTAWLHAPGVVRPAYGGAILCRDAATLTDCSRSGPGHKRAHLRAVCGTADARLHLASVHLPSDRFVTSHAAGDAQRVAELGSLLAMRPRADVVVGDMNCPPDSPPYRQMRAAGYVDVVAGRGHRVHGPDYIWLDARLAERCRHVDVLDGGDFWRADDTGNWRLSDHVPVLLELAEP
jgi:endonuclease/exonuclease/phosphatase family metal-dependent hydrolase